MTPPKGHEMGDKKACQLAGLITQCNTKQRTAHSENYTLHPPKVPGATLQADQLCSPQLLTQHGAAWGTAWERGQWGQVGAYEE